MYGVALHAHPVRGDSHNQRNTTGEAATLPRLSGILPGFSTNQNFWGCAGTHCSPASCTTGGGPVVQPVAYLGVKAGKLTLNHSICGAPN